MFYVLDDVKGRKFVQNGDMVDNFSECNFEDRGKMNLPNNVITLMLKKPTLKGVQGVGITTPVEEVIKQVQEHRKWGVVQ